MEGLEPRLLLSFQVPGEPTDRPSFVRLPAEVGTTPAVSFEPVGPIIVGPLAYFFGQDPGPDFPPPARAITVSRMYGSGASRAVPGVLPVTILPYGRGEYAPHLVNVERDGDLTFTTFHAAAQAAFGPATKLPNADGMRFNDAFDPSRLERFYRITVNPATGSIVCVLKPAGPGSPLLENLTLMDGEGHSLAGASPDGNSGTVRLEMAVGAFPGGPPRFSSLILRVGLSPDAVAAYEHDFPGSLGLVHDAAGDFVGLGSTAAAGDFSLAPPDLPGDLAALGFELTVSRESGPDTSASDGHVAQSPSSPAVVILPTSSPALRPGVVHAGFEPEWFETAWTPPPDADDRPVTVDDPQATGPLPGRAAAPLGGVLASGEDRPQSDQRDPSFVDLALIDIAAEPRVGVEPVDAAPAGDAFGAYAPPPRRVTRGGPVVTLRGPGGVPLLGSSVMTAVGSGLSGGMPELPALASSRDPSDTFEVDAADVATPDPRPRGVRRTSLAAGLSVALALTLGLTLPEVTDPLRTRAPARLFLRRWLRKMRRERRA